jgi:hypothetical protein
LKIQTVISAGWAGKPIRMPYGGEGFAVLSLPASLGLCRAFRPGASLASAPCALLTPPLFLPFCNSKKPKKLKKNFLVVLISTKIFFSQKKCNLYLTESVIIGN